MARRFRKSLLNRKYKCSSRGPECPYLAHQGNISVLRLSEVSTKKVETWGRQQIAKYSLFIKFSSKKQPILVYVHVLHGFSIK